MPPVEGTIHGPLAGIRVIDLSTVLAGPYATMILADLGADVVKVEPPGGDATRGWGPPWVGDEEAGTRTAAYYLAVNRNKRSLRLDLRADAGREVLRRLLVGGDVLVENFRPGSLDRLGFDDATIASINPALIHLAISGYGPTGPAADRPGYDFVIQAVGGLMSITGEADEDGGRPMKVGVAISDVVTGLYAAIGVLAGLLARHGVGQRVDVSLLGSTLAVLVNQAQNAFVTGVSPVRRGNAHPNIVPYETFATADGELAVAVGSERQWPRFCEALGLPELAADPRFATNGDRVERRAELRPTLAQRFAERSTAAWGTALDAADVPWGAIADVATALASPEAAALEAVVDVEHPVLGAVRQVGSPFRLADTPGSIRAAPPLLGEHTDEVLAEIGYTPAEIEVLRDGGVV
jgi:crotonobetainyl-CoA:carnitine CoA-transferase CaiB-like acyl-CoA transferase